MSACLAYRGRISLVLQKFFAAIQSHWTPTRNTWSLSFFKVIVRLPLLPLPAAVAIRNMDQTVSGEITFDVDILQATISGTPEYIEAADGLSADIVFCRLLLQ